MITFPIDPSSPGATLIRFALNEEDWAKLDKILLERDQTAAEFAKEALEVSIDECEVYDVEVPKYTPPEPQLYTLAERIYGALKCIIKTRFEVAVQFNPVVWSAEFRFNRYWGYWYLDIELGPLSLVIEVPKFKPTSPPFKILRSN